MARRHASSASGPRDRHFTMALVCLACGIDYACVGLMRTIMPYFAETLTKGVGTATLIGSLESCYGFGQLLGGSFCGRMSDFQGRRFVLMLSILGAAIGYTLSGYAVYIGSSTLLLMSRFPVGLAKQTATVSRSIVSDLTADCPERRSFFMSLLAASFGLGYSLGPYLGGKVAQAFGSTSPAFAASTVFLLVLMPTIHVFLPETRDLSSENDLVKAKGKFNSKSVISKLRMTRSWQSVVAPLFANKQLIRVVGFLAIPEVCLIMHSTTSVAAFAIAAGVDKSSLGFSNSLTAGLASLCSAFLLPLLVTQGWTDGDLLRLGQGAFIVVSATLMIGSSESYLSPDQSIFWASFPMAIVASVLRAVPPAIVSKTVGRNEQGGAMGVLDLMSSSCRVFAPLICGILIDHVGVRSPFLFQATMCMCGFALVFSVIGPGMSIPPDRSSSTTKEKSM